VTPVRHGTASRLLVATMLALLAVTPLMLDAGPAHGQDSPEVRLRVTSLPLALGPGSVPPPETGEDVAPADPPEHPEDVAVRAVLENTGDVEVEGLRFVVEVHPVVTDREALAEALDAGEVPSVPLFVRDEPVRDLEPLAPGEIAGAAEEIAGAAIPWAEDGGVHPVRIAVVRGAQVLDEVVTGVTWLQDHPEDPLLTTAVWPLDDVPWRTTRGHYPASAQRSVRPGERIDTLVRVLERHPDAGVLLAPAAHLLEDLDDQASGFVELRREPDGTQSTEEIEPEDSAARLANTTLQRIRQVARELPHGPVTGPYADADLGALAEHDQAMRDLGGELSRLGRERLQRLVDRAPDASTTVLAEPIDERVLDLLPDHLLLPPGLVEDPDLEGVGDLRAPSGRPLTVTVGDPRSSALLADPADDHGPLVAAQRLLLEGAAYYFEAPEEHGRTLALHPPADWAPDADLIDRLLHGLAGAAWLELVTPATQASSGQRAPDPVELVAPEPGRLSAELTRDITSVLTDLEAARRAEPAEVDTTDVETPRRSFTDLRDAVLRSTSRWYGGGAEAEALVRDVKSDVDRTFGDVEVASGSRITLTAESGQIPITLRRTRGDPITVRVEVASQGRLVWPEGRQSEDLVLSDREAHTVSFPTRALSMGTFPVTVRVTDPSGERELGRASLSVRSTRVSGPALAATGGFVLVLLLAGALRRKPRRPHLAVVDDAEGADRRY
jgi:hypothetical protein